MSNPIQGHRPIWPPIWRCSSPESTSWVWIGRRAVTSPRQSGQFFGYHLPCLSMELIVRPALDYAAVQVSPKNAVLVCLSWAPARMRDARFPKFQEIAQSVGAYLMVDIAHIAGLIAAGLHPNPVPYADFVTTTTHKTLRGPRGGIVMCKAEHAKAVDKIIFPGCKAAP